MPLERSSSKINLASDQFESEDAYGSILFLGFLEDSLLTKTPLQVPVQFNDSILSTVLNAAFFLLFSVLDVRSSLGSAAGGIFAHMKNLDKRCRYLMIYWGSGNFRMVLIHVDFRIRVTLGKRGSKSL
jgi:hypothetical protein